MRTTNPKTLSAVVSVAAPKIVGKNIAEDLRRSVFAALESGASFQEGTDPAGIFRAAVAAAVTSIEERAGQLRRFLRDGPYEYMGDAPAELQGKRLTDQETAQVINFVYAHVVNCFQGRLAELLAAGPCAQLVSQLKASGRVSPSARLYIGDSVLVATNSGTRRKSADMHLLDARMTGAGSVEVQGVVEVKSYVCSNTRLRRQLDSHLARIREGRMLHVAHDGQLPAQLAANIGGRPLLVGVIPASWKLPRTFFFHEEEGSRYLVTDVPLPPRDPPRRDSLGLDEWQIVLPWSQEALASAAYGMTFWYMEKLGEQIYPRKLPPDWNHMTPGEAGRNAAKMMLYYAMRRNLEPLVLQRAVALYNTYCFGYALGMNFRDRGGKRQMLWDSHLEEIAQEGATKEGWSIRG